MLRSFCGLLFALLLMTGASCNSTAARNRASVSSPQPNNSMVLGVMLHRGAADFANVEKRFASDYQELETLGYVPYQLPELTDISYLLTEPSGDPIVSSNGKPLEDVGQLVDPLYVKLRPPVDANFTVQGESSHKALQNGEWVWVDDQDTKAWTWPGGKWAESGLEGEELSASMRRLRLLLFLSWSAKDFIDETGKPPQDLAVLEQYLALNRAEEAWSGIVTVEDLSAVPDAGGNLYIGYSPVANGELTFTISLNLGPEVQTHRFIKQKDGSFTRDPAMIFY